MEMLDYFAEGMTDDLTTQLASIRRAAAARKAAAPGPAAVELR
jgi:TolB-like protein